ncbi:hypothetical protein ZWY2020_035832 [Hordeum vulgare]|nr:hypothetical protein ZWY2020_035832 [Hordeum vulgare]
MMAAQMKAFETPAASGREQSLAGKPAGVFATGTQGGGCQETTAHGRDAAHAPRHAVRACRIHARRRHVRHGRGQGRQSIRELALRRCRWQQGTQRRRASLWRAHQMEVAGIAKKFKAVSV